ncbi:GGDEF domain-containing protein [Vibrio amylolyticus]|uniref:GGDEF domain-containing protein n=1 Tax=Vibrio amylolyticus TaxID=2847292 RepID=UPI00354F16FE
MVDMQKEDWFNLILHELPERLWVIDENGYIRESFGDTNPLSTAHSKCYINQTIDDIYPPPVAEQLNRYMTQVLTSDSLISIQYSLESHQQLQLSIADIEAQELNGELWFEATLKPISLSNGSKVILWQEREITQSYRQRAELKKLSETDELTGILNRRAFVQGLEQEFNDPAQRSLSCLMVDIDHFKEINDQVGHLSGDEVITHVAQICQGLIRTSDYIGRLGGEEFGIVLTNTSAIQAYEIAERIRQSIEEASCTVDGHVIYATASIGISELTSEVSSVRELLKQADKAMYYSKQTGRNQVTLYYDNLPSIKNSQECKANILQAS